MKDVNPIMIMICIFINIPTGAAALPFDFRLDRKEGKKNDFRGPTNITCRLNPEEVEREGFEGSVALKGLACPWLLLILFGRNSGFEPNPRYRPSTTRLLGIFARASRLRRVFRGLRRLVALTGIEPVLSALRGQRVNQLHHSAT